MPILTGTLALTVFLTSLVLQTHRNETSRASIRTTGADVAPSSSQILLVRHPNPRSVLAEPKPATDAEARTTELLSQARRFVRAGNLQGGMELLRAALKLDPKNLDALEALGVLCFARHQYADAETYLRGLLEADPEADIMCRARLGVAQMRQRKYGPALDNLRIVLQKEPTDGALHFALACVYARLMDANAALRHLEMAYAQMGPALLAHVSEPDLDSLRETREFQRILNAARAQSKRGLPDAKPRPPVAPES